MRFDADRALAVLEEAKPVLHAHGGPARRSAFYRLQTMQRLVRNRLQVDDERKQIRFDGQVLELSRIEYRLLKLLIERPGRVFSRDELMSRAWDDPGGSYDRTVDAHVKSLRAKLRAVDPDSEPIQTHRGMGYSLREPGDS